MKTAVSIPDDLFEEADRLARLQATSRSALYARALREYVARHSPEHVTELMNQVVDAAGGSEDEFAAAAARQALQATEW